MNNMKYIFTLILIFVFTIPQFGQVFFSRTGHIHVSSSNSIKKIEADNFQVSSFITLETKEVKFEGLLKSFEFKLGALDRVFNSERINVNQYPKIKFEGKIVGLPKNFDPNKKADYDVEVKGILYIWDEKRKTSANGKITCTGDGELFAKSGFIMRIEENSMKKLNELIDKKLPSAINVSTESFGVSRDIYVDLDVAYQLRNW